MWNPSQQRAPAGSAGGGRFAPGGGSASSKSSTKSPKKTAGPKAKPWGTARNAEAAKAQANPQAQKMFTDVTNLPPNQRGAYVKGLSDAQLQQLTAIAYSSATSDPSIVNARIWVANEMSRRGMDVKKYGALGGGASVRSKAPSAAAKKAAVVKSAKKATPAKVAPKAAAKPSPAVQAAITARAGSQVISATSVRAQ